MKLSLGITPRDYSVIGGASYDADAQAYFTANTSITSDADKTAINDFYLGLKSDGIYTKIKAMYLLNWGSASACKWNLINPQDTNAAFRATFASGLTYSSTGITGNGTSGYINSNFNPTGNVSQNSFAIGFYCRTSTVTLTRTCIGGQSSTFRSSITPLNSSTVGSALINSGAGVNFSNTNGQGFFQTTRLNNTQIIAGKNTTFTTLSQTSTGLTNVNMFAFALNFTTISNYFDGEGTFFYLASGLTQTEMTNFRTRVQTLMTYFGIQV